MIDVMEEHEQAHADSKSRLLTRAELLTELRRLGYGMTDRQLRDWVTDGILPRPERRLPPGATDGIARAVYPEWMIGVISDLLIRPYRAKSPSIPPQVHLNHFLTRSG